MIIPLLVYELIASYIVIGVGIKFLDQKAEEPHHEQPGQAYLWLVTAALIVIINIWVFYDAYTAVLGLGIILGLIVTRKIDNAFFFTLAIAIIPLCFFRMLTFPVLLFLFPTLLMVFFASTLDEFLHSKAENIKTRGIRWVLEHRPILKITVLILPFFGYLTLAHTIAFWAFDIAYDLMTYYFGAFQSKYS